MVCELAKCASNRHSDKYTNWIYNLTLAPPPSGWEMLRTFHSEGIDIHVSRPVAENQWKNNKMNSLNQREICDGTDCLSEILHLNRLPVLTCFKLEFHSNLGAHYADYMKISFCRDWMAETLLNRVGPVRSSPLYINTLKFYYYYYCYNYYRSDSKECSSLNYKPWQFILDTTVQDVSRYSSFFIQCHNSVSFGRTMNKPSVK